VTPSHDALCRNFSLVFVRAASENGTHPPQWLARRNVCSSRQRTFIEGRARQLCASNRSRGRVLLDKKDGDGALSQHRQ
jgi:hypothetical protein